MTDRMSAISVIMSEREDYIRKCDKEQDVLLLPSLTLECIQGRDRDFLSLCPGVLEYERYGI